MEKTSVLLDGYMDKENAMGHYSAMKKEILPFVTPWVNLTALC